MKVTLHYWKDDSGYMPYCVKTDVDGKHYFGCGHTFSDAKERLKNSIRYLPTKEEKIPPDEEIEV